MKRNNRNCRSGENLIEEMNQTAVPHGGVAVWHLGQASVALKTGDVMFYIDPYLSDSLNEGGAWPRKFDPPLQPEDVTNAGYVLITHDHGDHLDPVSLRGIESASPNTRFICPAPAVERLQSLGIPDQRIIEARAGEWVHDADLSVLPVACQHEEFAVDENGDHAYLGYIVKTDGVLFYHAGDTILHRELIEALKPFSIDLAFLPINGRDYSRAEKGIAGNMGFREAADLTGAVQMDLVIPIHYDLFPFNADNPAYFVDYLYAHYPGQCFKMMVPGERMLHLGSGVNSR